MAAIFATLVPVFLLIVLGAALTRFKVLERSHWTGVERLTYQVLIPPLMIVTLIRTDLSGGLVGATAAVLLVCVVAMAGLTLALRPVFAARFGVGGPAFASIFQGATRWNSFAALAIAASLYGTTGTVVTAIAILVMVPLLNILCVLVHVRYASARPATTAEIVTTILANPFIWSTLAGIALNLIGMATGLALPGPVVTALDLIARATLAVSLIVVGGGLDLEEAARLDAPIAAALALKLVVMPTIALAGGLAAGIGGAALGALVLCAAVPTATASYVLARQMGGDAPLMARITTVQTLVAAASLPAWLALAAALG